MDVHDEYFSDFLLHYEYLSLHDLQTELPHQVHQSPYVVIAHIVGVVSTNAFGVDIIAEDHTGTALLALRGDSAFDFYEEHLRDPDHSDTITDPYLFRIDSASQITIDGKLAFSVPKICMISRVIDQFFHYKMSEDDTECYRRAKAVVVPCGNGYESSGARVSPYDSRFLDLGIGAKKRIYAPYMP